jgi:hypothetical protein
MLSLESVDDDAMSKLIVQNFIPPTNSDFSSQRTLIGGGEFSKVMLAQYKGKQICIKVISLDIFGN